MAVRATRGFLHVATRTDSRPSRKLQLALSQDYHVFIIVFSFFLSFFLYHQLLLLNSKNPKKVNSAVGHSGVELGDVTQLKELENKKKSFFSGTLGSFYYV